MAYYYSKLTLPTSSYFCRGRSQNIRT